MARSGVARMVTVLRDGVDAVLKASTIKRLFLMWLGLIAMAFAGELSLRALSLLSIAYAAFVLVYYSSVVVPPLVMSRVGPLGGILAVYDWFGKVLVYRWTRSLVAFVLLLVLIAEEPSVRNLFVAAFITILLIPDRLPDEEMWAVSCSCESESDQPPGMTIDGDETTFWSSAGDQQEGMSLEVDFGRQRYTNGLSIYYGGRMGQSAKQYELFARTDSEAWEPVKVDYKDAKSPAGHAAHLLRFEWAYTRGLRLAIADPRPRVRWTVAQVVPHFNWRNRHDLAVVLLAMLAVLLFLAYHFYVAPATQDRHQRTYGEKVHGAPDFSPDGRILVYDTDDAKEGYNRLRLLDLVTGADDDVQVLGEGRHWHASFCSTKDSVVFSSTLLDARRSKNSHIFALDLTTGELRQITVGEDRRADWPHCSPDGAWVVYSALDDNERDQLFMADMVEGEATAPQPITMLDGDAIHPRFSPDGKTIVFAGRQVTDQTWTLYSISGTEEDWGPPTRLLPATVDSFHPDYAPDGGSVIFTRRECGALSLYQLVLEDGSLFWLGYLWDTDGTFSSDGKTIAFASGRGGNWQVYTMPVPVRRNPPFVMDSLIKRAHLLLLDIHSRLAPAPRFRPDPLTGY